MFKWFNMLKKVLLVLLFLTAGCSYNSGRIRLLNYDLRTELFGDVPNIVSVSRGDTLYSISRRYDVPLRDLITINGLTPPYTLSVGQIIRIPSAKYHIVAKGDTLYNISKRYNIDLTTLSRLNNLRPPYTLSIGQRLALPGSISSTRNMYAENDDEIWLPSKTQTVSTKKSSVKKTTAAVRKKVTTKKNTYAKKATKKQSYKPSPVKRRTAKFGWPVRGKIISKFGTIGKGRNNDGINIKAAEGTTVRAADKGTIVYAGNELKGFGNLILIRHSGGWITAYAHNQKLLVRKGQKVVKGEKIATVGETGGVNEPQLHFEVRAGKKPVNPLSYLP